MTPLRFQPRRGATVPALLLLALSITGCAGPGPFSTGTGDVVASSCPNPLLVQTANREFLWNQIVDTVDDYFEIQHEERVRLYENTLIEGRIDTLPKVGSTLLEPWRKDSTPGPQRVHATLQTVRRRATVRVLPDEHGYLVDVAVFKELEDLHQPEHATVGSATLRYDDSLQRPRPAAIGEAVTLGWIPLGRDLSLEQEIVQNLRARLHEPVPARLPPVGP